MHTTAKFWKNTLVALLRERYPDERLQICHRIDRETSGVLLIARTAAAASFLKRAFAARAVKKSYLALVHGVPAPPAGVIDAPMRLLDTRTHIKMGVAPTACPRSPTTASCATFARHALVEAAPETGRQHQIRVHLAHIGHPIVGDKLYGGGEQAFMDYCDHGLTPELLELFDGLPRHALHAARLTFPHPRTREPITVESPLPADLVDYMQGSRLSRPCWSASRAARAAARPPWPRAGRGASGRPGRGGTGRRLLPRSRRTCRRRSEPGTTSTSRPPSTRNGCARISAACRGEATARPVYDFATHTRRPETVRIAPSPVVIVEGILVLALPSLRELLVRKVFVDASEPARLERRIARDVGERGRTRESVVAQFARHTQPMHELHVAPSRAHADLVVSGEGDPAHGVSRVLAAMT